MEFKNYYFVTYRAELKKENNYTIWNDCINISPMDFILKAEKYESESINGGYYKNFRILNTVEITKDEYIRYSDKF